MPLAWTRKQEAGPCSLPGLSPFDELDREAALVKRRGRGQACHAAADDQDLVDLCHVPSDRVALNRHCVVRKGLAGSAIAYLGLGGTMTWTKVKSCGQSLGSK